MKKVALKILNALCTRVKIDFGVLVMQTDEHVYHCGYCHRLWYFQPITFIENTALKVYTLSNKFPSMLSIIKQGNIIFRYAHKFEQPYTNGNSPYITITSLATGNLLFFFIMACSLLPYLETGEISLEFLI